MICIIRKRPWDGKVRVRMINYFGVENDPIRLELLKKHESQLYVQEELDRLLISDKKRNIK